MLSDMRERWGKGVILAIIIFIGFVFVFWGVFTPDPSRMGAVAGSVNGERISLSEFSRELNQRIAMYKQMNFPMAQLKKMGIQKSVFDSIVRRKLLVQEAERVGMIPSDEEVRQKIQEMPVFQEKGQFDLTKYEKLLEANRYSPGKFERLIRQDIMGARWNEYFRELVRVSNLEIQQEHVLQNDKRSVKYFLVKSAEIRKQIKISQKDIDQYLKDKTKETLVRSRFDSQKDTKYKGRKFDDAKVAIARELLRLEQTEAVNKKVNALADKALKAFPSSSKLAKIVGDKKAKVETSDLMNRERFFVPGAGRNDALKRAVFSDQSLAKTPRKYPVASGVLIVQRAKVEKASGPPKDEERERLANSIASRKRSELYNDWMKTLTERATIEMSDAVLDSALGT